MEEDIEEIIILDRKTNKLDNTLALPQEEDAKTQQPQLAVVASKQQGIIQSLNNGQDSSSKDIHEKGSEVELEKRKNWKIKLDPIKSMKQAIDGCDQPQQLVVISTSPQELAVPIKSQNLLPTFTWSSATNSIMAPLMCNGWLRCYMLIKSTWANTFQLCCQIDNSSICKIEQKFTILGDSFNLWISHNNLLKKMGTLRKNILGTQFILTNTRQEKMAIVNYECFCCAKKDGQRKLQAYLYDNSAQRVLYNKKAQWIQQKKVFCLNFGGRVKMSSKSNMIMVDKKNEQLLIFGQAAEDKYILDFKHPLSPIQALAIGLSSIASKLAST